MNMCLIQLISTERHYLSVCNLFLNFFFLVSIIVIFFFCKIERRQSLEAT